MVSFEKALKFCVGGVMWGKFILAGLRESFGILMESPCHVLLPSGVKVMYEVEVVVIKEAFKIFNWSSLDKLEVESNSSNVIVWVCFFFSKGTLEIQFLLNEIRQLSSSWMSVYIIEAWKQKNLPIH